MHRSTKRVVCFDLRDCILKLTVKDLLNHNKVKYYGIKRTILYSDESCFLNLFRVTISGNEIKIEEKNSCLKQELQQLQEKLENSQLRKQSEICALNSQLAACMSELAKDSTEKERIKAEMKTLKGKF